MICKTRLEHKSLSTNMYKSTQWNIAFGSRSKYDNNYINSPNLNPFALTPYSRTAEWKKNGLLVLHTHNICFVMYLIINYKARLVVPQIKYYLNCKCEPVLTKKNAECRWKFCEILPEAIAVIGDIAYLAITQANRSSRASFSQDC